MQEQQNADLVCLIKNFGSVAGSEYVNKWAVPIDYSNSSVFFRLFLT